MNFQYEHLHLTGLAVDCFAFNAKFFVSGPPSD